MKNFVAKLSKGARWAIGLVAAILISNLTQMPSLLAVIFAGILLVALIAFVYCCMKIKTPPTAKELEKQRRLEEIENAKLKAEQEHAERAAKKAEWEQKHGKIYTKLAGVTFSNDDGSSRQSILKEFSASGDGQDVELEVYDHEGEQAIRVMWEGYCCGNIPRKAVKDILNVEDKIETISMSVETFTPSDSDDDFDYEGRTVSASKIKLYRADLCIVYSKE